MGTSASAIRVFPTMTSGSPLVNSRTLFRAQSADFAFDSSASSTLSNMLMVPVERIITPEPRHLTHNRHEAFPDTSEMYQGSLCVGAR
jgi:hypothetical protein